jgi:hypothetical protein
LGHSWDLANKDEIFGLENKEKIPNTVVYNDICCFLARLLTLFIQKARQIKNSLHVNFTSSFWLLLNSFGAFLTTNLK